MSRAPFDQLVTFLSVADLDTADGFYRSLLGLPLVLDQGACRIYRVAGTSFVGVCHNPELAGAAEGIIVTLVTDNVDEVHDRLVAAAVTVDHPPAYNRRFDIYHCFVRDPDGHRIEIQQFRDQRWPRPEGP